MATKTQDLAGANRFLRKVRFAHCSTMFPGMPESLLETIPYACLEVVTGPGNALQAAAASGSLHVFVSGEPQIEAVLAFGPEPDFDADLRVVVAATSERALRDVLLAFPGGHMGFFYVAGDWPLRAMEEVFDGQAMPAREGYCATAETFRPDRTHEARRLSSSDYAVLREHWSEDVWREVLDLGYAVYACQDAEELQAFCFHWNVSPSRHEVHGLQGVKDFSARYAESVVSAATDDVLGIGSVATCTAVRSSEIEYRQAFERVGYRRFYRVDSFLGMKRGGPRFVAPSLDVFYRGRAAPRPRAVELGQGLAATKRDPVTQLYRELSHPRARLERGRFLAEGITLVRRAIDDCLPMESVVYIPDLLHTLEGIEVLERARRAGVDHYRVSNALMGTLTTSRPLPRIIAAVRMRPRDAAELWTSPRTSLAGRGEHSEPRQPGHGAAHRGCCWGGGSDCGRPKCRSAPQELCPGGSRRCRPDSNIRFRQSQRVARGITPTWSASVRSHCPRRDVAVREASAAAPGGDRRQRAKWRQRGGVGLVHRADQDPDGAWPGVVERGGGDRSPALRAAATAPTRPQLLTGPICCAGPSHIRLPVQLRSGPSSTRRTVRAFRAHRLRALISILKVGHDCSR